MINRAKRRRWWWLALIGWIAACTRPASTPATLPTVTPTTPFTAVITSTTLPAVTTPPTGLPVPESVLTPTPEPRATVYTVQPGDTLLGLALRWGLPMAALQLANGLGESTELQVGQPLTIPPVNGWEGASPFWVVRLVAEGDTLLGIAARYGLDFTALAAVNNLTYDDVLTVGQPLILPLEVPADLAQATATAPPTAEPVATTAAPVLSTPAVPSPVLPSGDLAAWAAETFRLINEQRAAYGIPPYTWNDTLALAAQLHGEDCRAHNSWSHTGSDGSRVKDRLWRAGYPAVGAAECFVYAASPQQAVAWWMDEAPPDDWHRRTLLSTWVTEVGVAVIPDGRGSYYFFADFGKPQ